MRGDTGSLIEANREIYQRYPVPVHTFRVKRIEAMLASLPPSRLLDLGCAQGELGVMALGGGWTVNGLDIDPSNAQRARERGLQTCVGTFSGVLPFTSESFGCILAAEILEHVLDTQLLLSECYRLLYSGGHLVLSTPNLASLNNRLRLVCGLYPSWMDFTLTLGAGHVRYYTLPVLRQQMSDVGFQITQETGTIVQIPGIGRIRTSILQSLMSYLALRAPSVASGLVVLAVKPDCGNLL